jgi:hypothetical protein
MLWADYEYEGGRMRKFYVALVTTAGLLLAFGASAEAAGRGGVGSGFVPHGLMSTNPGFTNGNKGNNITGATTSGQTTGYGPSGWSQGAQGNANAPDPWKGISSPPGLK